MSMEGDGSGIPDSTIEPSRGVVGLIQQNTDEGRCLLENPSEILMKAALCCCCILLLRFYAWAVIFLCSTVVGHRQCMLYGPLRITGITCGTRSEEHAS